MRPVDSSAPPPPVANPVATAPAPRGRKVRGIHLFLGGILLALLLAGGAILWLATHEEEIEAVVLAELGKSLLTDAHIGDMHVSWWQDFPRITVGLESVWLAGSGTSLSDESPGDTLLRAGRLGLAFDLIQLFQGQYVLHGLSLEDGELNLERRQDGSWNWDVWKTDSTSTEVEKWAITRFAVERSTLRIDGQEVKVEQLVCSGSWENNQFQAKLKGQILPHLPILSADAPMGMLEGEVTYEPTLGQTKILLTEATWAGIEGFGEASITADEDPKWRLEFEGISMEALQWLSDLPPSMSRLKFQGGLSGHVSGSDGNLQGELRMKASDFHWESGWNWGDFALGDLSGRIGLAGTWSLSREGMLVWKSRQFFCEAPGLTIEGQVSGKGWEQPQIEFTGEISAHRAAMGTWLPWPVSWGEGWPDEGSLHYDGTLVYKGNALQLPRGTWNLQGLSGTWMEEAWTLDAQGSMRAGDLTVDNSALHWGLTVGTLSGTLNQVWPWEPEKGIKASIQGDFRALDLRPWTQVAQGDSTDNSEKVAFPLPFSVRHEIDVRLDVDALSTTTHTLSRLRMLAQLEGTQWTVSRLDFGFTEGRVSSDWNGTMDAKGLMGIGFYRLEGLNLPMLFSSFQNFDQQTLRSEHLEGQLFASGQIQFALDSTLRWMPGELAGFADVRLENGVLTGVEVFEEVVDELRKNRLMAPWVDPDDLAQRLKKIRFGTLESRFNLWNETISFPPTALQSTAMNIVLSGEHSFSGLIDYSLGFTLRDLRNIRRDKIGEVLDDGLGNVMFIRMTGDIDSPTYSWDRDAQRRHRLEEWEAEKREIQSLFRRNTE
jgi:hypothetical protein